MFLHAGIKYPWFVFFQKADQIQGNIDAAHAGVYRLVTWIGTYDEAKVRRVSVELTAKIEGAAAVAGQQPGAAFLRTLYDRIAPGLYGEFDGHRPKRVLVKVLGE